MVRPISFKLTNADVIVYLFNTFYTVSLYLKPVSVHFKIRFVARDEMADRFTTLWLNDKFTETTGIHFAHSHYVTAATCPRL